MEIETLGKHVKTIREGYGMTQEHLAELSGISMRTLSMLECGASNDVQLTTLIRIAEGLGIKLSSLLFDNYDDFESDNEMNCARRNYLERDERYIISTFVELVLILPILDYSVLLDCCRRLACDVVGNEQYACQLFTQAFINSPNSKAKTFISNVLNLIHEMPRDVMVRDPINILWTALYAKSKADPSFVENREEYLKLIEERQGILALFNDYIVRFPRLSYVQM